MYKFDNLLLHYEKNYGKIVLTANTEQYSIIFKQKEKIQNMSEYRFNVNLGGMIDILSNHLYSTPKVFLRELLQNAADAVSLRKNIDKTYDSPEINIFVKQNSSLCFRDNGCGLTEEEIHKFISVIGESSKRSDSGAFIGRFGIGLLSCFIVTDEIILRTRSAKQPDKAFEWHGFSDGRYAVTEIQSDIEIGTEIVINAAKPYAELFTFDEVLENIKYYGLPIPYPIYISSEDDLKVRANVLFGAFKGDEHKDTLEMGRRIFGVEYDFLDCIPLSSKNDLFSGAAYILPYSRSAAAANKHRIYLKNMLLTEDGSSVLPEWAFFVKCFFNTNKLRPTASREDFYKDELLAEAKEEISLCISSYLERLSVRNPSLLDKIVSLHGTALKSIAAENDRLFDIFMPYFLFETSLGVISGTVAENYGKTIFYTSDIDTFRQLRPVFAEKGEMLVNTCYVYEKALIEKLGEANRATVEQLNKSLLEDMLEDAKNEDDFKFMIDAFSSALAEFDCRARLKSFSPAQLSAIYSINSDGETKRDIGKAKEASSDMFAEMLENFEKEIDADASAALYLNSSNPLIIKLAELSDTEKLSVYARIMYVQSLIAGGFPIHAAEMNIMNENLIKLIEWGI